MNLVLERNGNNRISVKTLGAIENDIFVPESTVIVALAEILGTDANDLLALAGRPAGGLFKFQPSIDPKQELATGQHVRGSDGLVHERFSSAGTPPPYHQIARELDGGRKVAERWLWLGPRYLREKWAIAWSRAAEGRAFKLQNRMRAVSRASEPDNELLKPCPLPEALVLYGSTVRLDEGRFPGRRLREKERNKIRLHLRDCSRCQSTLVSLRQGHSDREKLASATQDKSTRYQGGRSRPPLAALGGIALAGVLAWAAFWSRGGQRLAILENSISRWQGRSRLSEIQSQQPISEPSPPVGSAVNTQIRWSPEGTPSELATSIVQEASPRAAPSVAAHRSSPDRRSLLIHWLHADLSGQRAKHAARVVPDSAGRTRRDNFLTPAGTSSPAATQSRVTDAVTNHLETANARPPGEGPLIFPDGASAGRGLGTIADLSPSGHAGRSEPAAEFHDAGLTKPVAIVSAGGLTVWRLTPGGVIARSSDGVHWQPLSSGTNLDLVAGVAPSAEVCWAVGKSGTVMRTIDGEQWEQVASPTQDDLVNISAQDEYSATVWTVGGKSFVTNNGGKAWQTP
jgi:hypothetical protein